MKLIDKLAEAHCHENGDDCLCQRTVPGTPFGEHIYMFCGCSLYDAYRAGFQKAKELLRLKEIPSAKWLEITMEELEGLGEEEV